MIELTDKQQVLDRLAEGHELTNRGAGWWLSKPRTGNQPAVAQQVSEATVRELETSGRIRIAIPYTSAVARLVDAE